MVSSKELRAFFAEQPEYMSRVTQAAVSSGAPSPLSPLSPLETDPATPSATMPIAPSCGATPQTTAKQMATTVTSRKSCLRSAHAQCASPVPKLLKVKDDDDDAQSVTSTSSTQCLGSIIAGVQTMAAALGTKPENVLHMISGDLGVHGLRHPSPLPGGS